MGVTGFDLCLKMNTLSSCLGKNGGGPAGKPGHSVDEGGRPLGRRPYLSSQSRALGRFWHIVSPHPFIHLSLSLFPTPFSPSPSLTSIKHITRTTQIHVKFHLYAHTNVEKASLHFVFFTFELCIHGILWCSFVNCFVHFGLMIIPC